MRIQIYVGAAIVLTGMLAGATPADLNEYQRQAVNQVLDELKSAVATMRARCGAPVEVTVDWDSGFKGGFPDFEGNFRDSDAPMTFGRACVEITGSLGSACQDSDQRAAIARDVKALTCRFDPKPRTTKDKKQMYNGRGAWTLSLGGGALVALYNTSSHDFGSYATDWLADNLASAGEVMAKAAKQYIAKAEASFRKRLDPLSKSCGMTFSLEIDWEPYSGYEKRQLAYDPNLSYRVQEIAQNYISRFSDVLSVVDSVCGGVNGLSEGARAKIRSTVKGFTFHSHAGEPKLDCKTTLSAGILDTDCGDAGRADLTISWLSKQLGLTYQPPKRVRGTKSRGQTCEHRWECASDQCLCDKKVHVGGNRTNCVHQSCT